MMREEVQAEKAQKNSLLSPVKKVRLLTARTREAPVASELRVGPARMGEPPGALLLLLDSYLKKVAFAK